MINTIFSLTHQEMRVGSFHNQAWRGKAVPVMALKLSEVFRYIIENTKAKEEAPNTELASERNLIASILTNPEILYNKYLKIY